MSNEMTLEDWKEEHDKQAELQRENLQIAIRWQQKAEATQKEIEELRVKLCVEIARNAANGWVKCSDRLPPADDEDAAVSRGVLFFHPGGRTLVERFQVGYYWFGPKEWEGDYILGVDDVTHWHELLPPRTEG